MPATTGRRNKGKHHSSGVPYDIAKPEKVKKKEGKGMKPPKPKYLPVTAMAGPSTQPQTAVANPQQFTVANHTPRKRSTPTSSSWRIPVFPNTDPLIREISLPPVTISDLQKMANGEAPSDAIIGTVLYVTYKTKRRKKNGGNIITYYVNSVTVRHGGQIERIFPVLPNTQYQRSVGAGANTVSDPVSPETARGYVNSLRPGDILVYQRGSENATSQILNMNLRAQAGEKEFKEMPQDEDFMATGVTGFSGRFNAVEISTGLLYVVKSKFGFTPNPGSVFELKGSAFSLRQRSDHTELAQSTTSTVNNAVMQLDISTN